MTDAPEGAAADYLAALARLISGEPKEAVNQTLLAEGRLSITPASVAREAGRSRTPIAKKECAYPEVRTAILKAGGRASSARVRRGTDRKEIDGLRDENRVLTCQVRRLATLLVDASAELRHLETEVLRLRGDLRAQRESTPPRPGLLGIRESIRDGSGETSGGTLSASERLDD